MLGLVLFLDLNFKKQLCCYQLGLGEVVGKTSPNPNR